MARTLSRNEPRRISRFGIGTLIRDEPAGTRFVRVMMTTPPRSMRELEHRR